MKKTLKYSIPFVLTAMCFMTYGCQTIVTNVNDYLETPEGTIQIASAKDPSEKEENENTAEEKQEVSEKTEDEKQTEEPKEETEEKEEESELSSEEEEEETDTDSEEEKDTEELSEEDEEDKEDEEDDKEKEDEIVIPPGFDAEFYAQQYPDVVAVYGNDPKLLYKHYIEYGKAEGRLANAEGTIPEAEDTADRVKTEEEQ